MPRLPAADPRARTSERDRMQSTPLRQTCGTTAICRTKLWLFGGYCSQRALRSVLRDMTSPLAAGNTGVTSAFISPNRLGALFVITLLWLVASVAHAGQAAIVVDATTGRVLGQVNADEQNYPASLTKMMTLYLTFRELKAGRLTLEDNLPVSRWAANREPSKLGLRPGKTISVQDCILAMVTKSANDAATVAAESIGGSEAGFADMTDAQAALLGMSNTHFDNASGLPDPNNVSTARDLLTLAMSLYRDFPQYAPYFSTTEFTFEGRVVHGHNHLMDRYDGMDGLKTGYTAASGFNLASTAVRDGHRLFAVVLGGRTAAKRDRLMASLLDAGFEQSEAAAALDRKSTRLNSSHVEISYAVFCLKKKK